MEALHCFSGCNCTSRCHDLYSLTVYYDGYFYVYCIHYPHGEFDAFYEEMQYGIMSLISMNKDT